jgi:hypothetical protein
MVDVDTLRALRRLTDRILRDIAAEGGSGPVNWAHLGCVRASAVTDDSGESYYQVLIEEAAPEASELRAAVYAGLAEAGWTKVEVLTEW